MHQQRELYEQYQYYWPVPVYLAAYCCRGYPYTAVVLPSTEYPDVRWCKGASLHVRHSPPATLAHRPSLIIAYPNPKMRWIFASQNQTGRIGSTTLKMTPSIVIAYPNPKMIWVFGSQNQTGRIGWTTLIMKPELTCFFSNKVPAKNNQQRRSLDHVHTRTSSLHQSISAHAQMKLRR